MRFRYEIPKNYYSNISKNIKNDEASFLQLM